MRDRCNVAMISRKTNGMASLSAVAVVAVLAGPAAAQSRSPGGVPPAPGMSLAQSTAMRFPQPVRAGELAGRDMLQPLESQKVLGRVRDIVRARNGTVQVVMTFGGFLGFGQHLIAVPLDATALLGRDMVMVAYTPGQLRQLPDFAPAGTTPVPPDTVLEVGLAKPSH